MLTETLVSSLILALIVASSFTLNTESLRALSRSKDKDSRMTEISSINENVRQEVSKWRQLPDDTGARYDMNEAVCGDNMAQLLLNDMQLKTPNTLIAKGHSVISRNQGFVDVTVYLPQSAWCP